MRVQIHKLENFKVKIIGKIKAISTSKTRKMIAIKKKWRENGKREEDLGSNPHSKGDLFSRSVIDFLDKKVDKRIIIIAINNTIDLIKSMIKIIYTIIQ